MNDYAAFFNPELESILQEIARDPKAKLLEVPSSGQLICATHESRVSIAAPGLTSAEVELLEVHRETLGELLKQRCLIEFFADPQANTRLHRSVDANQRLEVRDEPSWRAETKKMLELPVVDERSQIGADVLSRCIAGGDRVVSIAQLATAMSKVTSMDQAPVYMAIDLLEQERYADALKVYERVLAAGASPLILSYCWEGVSVAHWHLGDFGKARHAVSVAVAEFEDRPVPLINWIDIASRMGDFGEAEVACKLLDELNCQDQSALDWFADHEHARVSGGSMFPLTQTNRSRVLELMNSTGALSKEVLRAILL